MENNIIKYCECGCGTIIKENRRFVRFHNLYGENNPAKTPESRKKISESKKGKPRTEETKNKISESFKKNGGHPFKGKNLTEEHKNNISKANKGKKRTEEQRKNISEAHKGIQSGENHPMYGKIHTEESKKKMSESHMGKTLSEEHKKKLSEANTGEKNFFWQGGISFSPYSPDFNKNLKTKTKERDDYTCQYPECNVKEKDIACHHIDYDKFNNNIDNLICLCSKHHGMTNSYREFWQLFYEEIIQFNKNRLNFIINPMINIKINEKIWDNYNS